MKGKIIKPNDKRKDGLIGSIILLVLGAILVINSNQIVTIAFQMIGTLIIFYGIYKLYRYLTFKKQFKMEDNDSLIAGIISIAVGLLLILLASILEIWLRYIIGFYLIVNGISKITITLKILNKSSIGFYSNLFLSGLYILLGLYTIFIANAAFIIIGTLLIISSIFDIITFLKN